MSFEKSVGKGRTGSEKGESIVFFKDGRLSEIYSAGLKNKAPDKWVNSENLNDKIQPVQKKTITFSAFF